MKKWYIDQSSIDGQGIFAARDIQAGEIVFFSRAVSVAAAVAPDNRLLRHFVLLVTFDL